jgi:hypothetical protein
MASGKILFFAANPIRSALLELDQEARGIEKKLRAGDHRDFFSLQTQWAATADDLLQALNQHLPGVVHFSGHGSADPPGIVLHGAKGGHHLVTAGALRRLFAEVGDNVKVVLLNACYSETQAFAVAEVVDCVIGMTGAVGDESARTFAASFYRALAFGRSVQNAFRQGLVAISLEDLGDEHLPILLVKEGVNADEIFLAPRASEVERLTPRSPPGERLTPRSSEVERLTPRSPPGERLTPRSSEVERLTPRSSEVERPTPRSFEVKRLTPRSSEVEGLTPRPF